MRNWLLTILVSITALVPPPAAASEALPFSSGEVLKYKISWPSGLDVGTATLRAEWADDSAGEPPSWHFHLEVEAAIPGFQVRDDYHSTATEELCSLMFLREITHGQRRTREKTTFDQSARQAHRVTLGGGGESTIDDIPKCAKDALAFFYYVRWELANGRVPPPGTIFYGAPYEIKIQPAGVETVTLHEDRMDADQLMVTVKGDVSESTFVVLVARDSARTLVRVTVPLEPGNFTMELIEE